MPAKKRPQTHILRDNREQKGWDFHKRDWCLGVKDSTLSTGDYALEGFEQEVVIERKGSTGELAQNVVDPRFERELARLDEYDHPFIIVEATWADVFSFPVNSGIPKSKWRSLRLRSSFLLRKINEFQLAYKAQWLFCGVNAREVAMGIFKRVLDEHAR